MKDDVRGACLALIMRRTSGSIAGRGPRPAALGWKLESGALPASDVETLRASIQGALTGAALPRRWTTSAPLRALLREYREVRQAAAPVRCNGRNEPRRKSLARLDGRPAGSA